MKLTRQALLAVSASAYSAALALVPASFQSVSESRRRDHVSFARIHGSPLFGIMDEVNSDSYDLLGQSKTFDEKREEKNLNDAYEVFLADLVFSPNDPRLDIVEKIDMAGDPEFIAWLENKGNSSTDPEERLALKDLHGMIIDIKQKIDLSKQAEERTREQLEEAEQKRIEESIAQAEAGRAMSNTEVLRQASKVDTAGVDEALKKQADAEEAEGKKTFLETELSPEIRMSYDAIVKELLPPYKPGDTVTSVVFNLYDRCDAQLIKVLTERSANGDTDSQAVIDAITAEQSNRMSNATVRLQKVLSLGDPLKMEGAIVRLARDQQIDEPFLLLLEANANQAEAAGAMGPAQLMRKLRTRAMEEKDKQTTSKEIQLLRQLLRTEESSEREKILEDAFTPREQLLVEGTAKNMEKAMDPLSDGQSEEEEKPMPDVPPPDFINACKAMLINFGNLGTDEKGDLATLVKQIASEAEVVATRIYGKGMTPQEQQDRAWKETTTSIFDLETMEIEAERRGEQAPWANPDMDDILPGFDKDGKMQVGGG